MRAVMLSVQPEWCDLILRGKKNVEVRKKRPITLEPPFKVYIYCKAGKSGRLLEMPNHKFMQMNERIVGTFICNDITRLTHIGTTPRKLYAVGPGFRYEPADELLKNACLTRAEAESYLKEGDGLAWHISELKIFDPPVKMKNFWGLKPCFHSQDCFSYDCYGTVDCDVPRSFSCPPQDFCYVEEKE